LAATLSVKQLKAELARLNVDSSACTEKSELVALLIANQDKEQLPHDPYATARKFDDFMNAALRDSSAVAALEEGCFSITSFADRSTSASARASGCSSLSERCLTPP